MKLRAALIAHISDTHITPPDRRLADRLDSAERLAQAVRTIQALDVRPDCVLATGDLTDRGEPEAYAVNGRNVQKIPLSVLMKLEGIYKARIAARRNGSSFINHVVTFGAVS